ncbi:MAG: YdcF family protein [Alphaproteobacteria bacterium]|nr:MAG: YdcF family protein [Alphaproteobacteria bacterium]
MVARSSIFLSQRRRQHALLRKFLAFALLLVLVALLIGFGRFMSLLPSDAPKNPKADAIIVLTGGGDRIAAGMKLLTDGSANRMLISGVNDQILRQEVRELISPERQEKFDCCVDLGTDARNTIGNAIESAAWAAEHGYNEVILVTAYYHMPRSLAEMKNADAGLTIIAYPVFPKSLNREGWWHSPHAIRLLVTEYGKYLVAHLRFRLNHG